MLPFVVRKEQRFPNRYSNISQFWTNDRFLYSRSLHGNVINKDKVSQAFTESLWYETSEKKNRFILLLETNNAFTIFMVLLETNGALIKKDFSFNCLITVWKSDLLKYLILRPPTFFGQHDTGSGRHDFGRLDRKPFRSIT